MRVFLIVLLVAVTAVLFLSGYSLFNTYTSLKYEVEEARLIKHITEEVLDKEKIYNSLVVSLWINIILCITAILLLADKIVSKRG